MHKRSTGIAAIILFTVFAIGCGQTFRPIATPVPQPGGDPSTFHHAVVVNSNPGVAFPVAPQQGCGTPPTPPCPGSTSNIDTTGDTNIGNAIAGIGAFRAGFVSVTRTYVVNPGDNTVTRYLTTSPTSPPVTIPMPAGCDPNYVFSRGSGFAYVSCIGTGQVAVLNSGLDSIVTTVNVGADPETLNGISGKVYALNTGSGSVSVIATIDNTVTSTVPVGGSPVWSDINQDGSLLFVANGAGYVSVIGTSLDNIVTTPSGATIPLAGAVSPSFAVFDRAKQRFYVVDSGGSQVFVIDAVFTSPTYLTVIATIPVGANPTSITVLANGAKAYTSNCGADTVSVINTTSNAVTGTINTGTCPIWLTSPPDSTRVIVGVQGAPNGTDFTDPPQILSINTQTDAILVRLKPPQQDISCVPASMANSFCALQIPQYVTMAP
jgi:YVTN family beta-propeller protein